MEVLLAVGIFAIVLLAINTVFFSAIRLERAVTRMVDTRQPLNRTFALLRRDLAGAVPPETNSYQLTRDFRCTMARGSMSSAASASLEFFTTTGVISDELPWGDLQRVRYELVSPPAPASAGGLDLVRRVARNVLALNADEEEEQFLMSEVARLEVLCFDGASWRETWDTTAGDTGLPLAVRVRVQLANTNNPNAVLRNEPLELFVPITTEMLTNQLAGGAL
jgi:type II secretion system protein J